MNLSQIEFTNNEFTTGWIYCQYIYHWLNLPSMNLPQEEFTDNEFTTGWIYCQ